MHLKTENTLDKTKKQTQRRFFHSLGVESKLVAHKVGEFIQATITQTSDFGVLCELDDGVKAIATEDHLRGMENGCNWKRRSWRLLWNFGTLDVCFSKYQNIAL